MADFSILAPEIARPGDPDLDQHLSGLRVSSVVTVLGMGKYAIEGIVKFSTSDVEGWHPDPETGQRISAAFTLSVTIPFGIQMDASQAHLAAVIAERLEAWRASQSLVTLTAAPGKWTLLSGPGGEVVMPP